MSSADITDNIRLGEECDFYYVDEHAGKKSVYRALTNNRFTLGLNNLTGDSALIFNSLQGLQGVLMKLSLPAQGVLDWTGQDYAISSGWGAAAINRLTYRIGNLPEQYQIGSQVLVQNMLDQDNQSAKDALYELMGLPLVGGTNPAGDFAAGSVKLDAFVPLNFPWYVATSRGTMRPLPTDLLMSPVIVRVQLNSLASILSGTTTSSPAPSATSVNWAAGSVRFRQVMMERQDDLLKNRTSASAVYSFPLKYYAQLAQQQLIVAPVALQANTVNLVGFRNGRVKKIVLYCQDAAVSTSLTRNPNQFAPLNNVQLTYNGDIYYQTEGQESLAWSLMSATSPPVFANSSLVGAPSNAAPTSFTIDTQDYNSYYTVIDLAQVQDQAMQATTAIGGLKVDNAVINLQLSVVGADGAKNFNLYAVYLYECTALFHQGSCDFIW